MAGDSRSLIGNDVKLLFQSTPAYGGRQHLTDKKCLHSGRFNPRPRMAGDKDPDYRRCPCHRFNPRPRMAGDVHYLQAEGCMVVSIHARVWRATVWSETLRDILRSFNPRPRMAGDQPMARSNTSKISFNPRPRMAGDVRNQAAQVVGRLFQSTPAYGGRRDCVVCGGSGCDVSIHARVWRATFRKCGECVRHSVSIHARVWRATQIRLDGLGALLVSIHARVWRATDKLALTKEEQAFQSTPAYGGRP